LLFFFFLLILMPEMGPGRRVPGDGNGPPPHSELQQRELEGMDGWREKSSIWARQASQVFGSYVYRWQGFFSTWLMGSEGVVSVRNAAAVVGFPCMRCEVRAPRCASFWELHPGHPSWPGQATSRETFPFFGPSLDDRLNWLRTRRMGLVIIMDSTFGMFVLNWRACTGPSRGQQLAVSLSYGFPRMGESGGGTAHVLDSLLNEEKMLLGIVQT
jgi:hypothetical protein